MLRRHKVTGGLLAKLGKELCGWVCWWTMRGPLRDVAAQRMLALPPKCVAVLGAAGGNDALGCDACACC